MKIKRTVLFMVLLVIAVGLGAFNYYLWRLQIDKKQYIVGLQAQVALHEDENSQLQVRNQLKAQEIETLRSPESFHLYEEKARREYGMIGNNETFFVLRETELMSIPDVPGFENKQLTANDESLPFPEEQVGEVITLDSLDDNQGDGDLGLPPQSEETTSAPLQLESLQAQ